MFCLPSIFRALILGLCFSFTTLVLAQAGETGGDWRKKLGTFRIGIIGGNRPILETRRAQPFRIALQKVLKMPVEIVAVQDYQTLIEAQLSSRIEYAVYSSSAFSTAWLLCKCIQPLVAPQSKDGVTGFRSILLVNKKEITSLKSVAGKTILIAGRNSFAGYILPRHQLAEQGVDITSTEWSLKHQASMETALTNLKKGEGAGIFGWVPSYVAPENKLQQKRNLIGGSFWTLGKKQNNFHSVWSSSPIPHGPHAIRTNLDGRVKKTLSVFLTSLHKENYIAYRAIENTFFGGLIPVKLKDYQPVISLVSKMLEAAKNDNDLALASPLLKAIKTP